MRVVHVVCSAAFAGVERYVANLAQGQVGAGAEVVVIGGDPQQMGPAVIEAGGQWHAGDSIPAALRQLSAIAPPDLVNTHMSDADLAGYLYRHRYRRRRVAQISTRHFAAPRGSGWAARKLLGLMARGIDADLAISQFVAASIEQSARVVYSGVPDRELSKTRDPSVLMVQRLEAEKDTATGIRAWAASNAWAQGWRLCIAGDGAERASLERLATGLGVADSVEFLGYRSDVDALLAGAGVLLATTPREGLGIAVLEAMSHGTPVIASAGGGHVETVGSVAPELLFAPGSAEAAAASLEALIADPVRREQVGVALWEVQRSRFTLAVQVEQTLALYREVISR